MKKLNVVLTVVARDNVVVRVSKRLQGTVDVGKEVIDKKAVDASLPYELKVIFGLSAVISEMTKAGVNGSIFVADSVMPRLLQAKKVMKKHNAVDIMMTSWMIKSNDCENYRKAFLALLRALRSAENNDVLVIFKPISELWKIKLEGADNIPDGTVVELKNGISERYGCRAIGSNRFVGSVTVKRYQVSNKEVVFGEIHDDTLNSKALDFLAAARSIVKSAMAALPPKVDTAAVVEVKGNF